MPQKSLRILVVILFISVAARLAVALYLGDVVDAPPLLTDQRSYHALGERLSTGHGFSFAEPWYPFYLPASSPTSHWSFLYSLFVAVVYSIFGPHILIARIIQAILGGILLPLMVYSLARRVFVTSIGPAMTTWLSRRGISGEGLALWAAGISAIYLYFVLYAATVMTETFYIVALLWSFDRAIALVDTPSLKGGLLLGLSLGVATLMRQSILPWIVVLVLWLLWAGWRTQRLPRMLRSVLLAAAALAAMIAPFTLRNYRVYGEFLLLNSNAGYAMYSAQHPMHGTSFQAFEAAPLPTDLRGQNEAQLDRELMQRGIQFVLADPGRYLLLSASRVPIYFEFWPTADSSLIDNFGRVASFGLFLPFMVYGLWLMLKHGGIKAGGGWRAFALTPMALFIGFIGFYSVLHIFTWAIPRYRLPIDAVAIIFAALGLRDIVRYVLAKLPAHRQVDVRSQEAKQV